MGVVVSGVNNLANETLWGEVPQKDLSSLMGEAQKNTLETCSLRVLVAVTQ